MMFPTPIFDTNARLANKLFDGGEDGGLPSLIQTGNDCKPSNRGIAAQACQVNRLPWGPCGPCQHHQRATMTMRPRGRDNGSGGGSKDGGNRSTATSGTG